MLEPCRAEPACEAHARFPGTLASLAEIRRFVGAAAARAELDKEDSYRARLAVDEIATNVVVYGYGAPGAAGELHLTARSCPSALAVEIEDTAAPFDPRAYPLPTEEDLGRPLAERIEGGLGLLLAARSVDAMDYQRDGDRNRTTLFFRGAAARPAGER